MRDRGDRMKKSIKITACIVSMALVLQIMPASVSASDVATGTSDTAQAAKTQSATTSTPQIVGELIDKREANVKNFKLSDGTFEAVEYQSPVHYQQDGYGNKDNSFDVKFARDVCLRCQR